ncbi:hypothetical protein, partial [Enterococcus faecalis]|uniref:hypothetical protein n=1 Tax=Enterococcus faecalis TaxID=1351 RepID=UPI003F539258
NIPLSQWAETFQDKKLTKALIDRLECTTLRLFKLLESLIELKIIKKKSCCINNLVIYGPKPTF